MFTLWCIKCIKAVDVSELEVEGDARVPPDPRDLGDSPPGLGVWSSGPGLLTQLLFPVRDLYQEV